MTEKEWLESSLINYFIEALNNMHSLSCEVIVHRDRPDFIIEEKQNKLRYGVEVTHLFYDQEDAKDLLGHQSLNNSKFETIEHYINILNKLILQKSFKFSGYDHSHDLILLIGVTSPLFNRHDFEISREDIFIPSNNYSSICLVFSNDINKRWEDLMFLKQECKLFNL